MEMDIRSAAPLQPRRPAGMRNGSCVGSSPCAKPLFGACVCRLVVCVVWMFVLRLHNICLFVFAGLLLLFFCLFVFLVRVLQITLR